MTEPVLEIQGLTKRFGHTVVNDQVSVHVRAGEVVGLLGHNGAGKTTLVSQIVGLLRPDAGTIEVAGVDAVAHPALARRSVALQAQAQAPLDGLTPRTAIEIAAQLRGMTPHAAAAAARSIAEELDILDWFSRRALPEGGGLSGGVRRLTSFAMAAVAPVPLVVLDEPTNDVDVARRRLLWQKVRAIADAGAGVLLVTHNVAEAERVVDHLVVLDQGTVVAAGSPAQLRGADDDDLRLELSLHPDGVDPTETGDDLPLAVSRRVRAGRRVFLTLNAAAAERAVAWSARLRSQNQIESYTLSPASLEDAYVAATSGAATQSDEAIDRDKEINHA